MKIQRKELVLQREEMAATRNEFIMNRATNIVYSQLERYESVIKSFAITNIQGNEVYLGQEAFAYLSDTFGINEAWILFVDSDPVKADRNVKIIKYLNVHKRILNQLLYDIYNIQTVIKKLFIDSDLKFDEFKNLHAIFVQNIGFSHSGIFGVIINEIESINKYKTLFPNKYDNLQVTLHGLEKYIKPIREFMQASVPDVIKDQKEFDEIKQKWEKEVKNIWLMYNM